MIIVYLIVSFALGMVAGYALRRFVECIRKELEESFYLNDRI